MELVRLTNTEKQSVAAFSVLCASAFIDHPAYNAIFPTEDLEKRRKIFSFFFEFNTTAFLAADPSCLWMFMEKDATSKVICGFSVTRSDRTPTPWNHLFSNGFLFSGVWRIGLSAFSRMVEMGSNSNKIEEELMQGRLHLTLHRMVVDPTAQGGGIGSRCLGKALTELADAQELPVYLDTQKMINVTFYRKLGFEVVKEYETTFTFGEPFTVWSMIREPKQQKSSP